MKDLRKIKIYVDGRSEEIQEKLFALDRGISWHSGEKRALNTNYPFLFIDKDGCLGYSNNMRYFTETNYSELTADEVLAMKPKKDYSDYKFEPFEKVLIRDNEEQNWGAIFLSHIDKNNITGFPYICAGFSYRYCIPYKGNEHLLGTNKGINE